LLWSINERLGGAAGLTIPRLTSEWVDDLIQVGIAQTDELEELQAEVAQKAKTDGNND
jgi:hypothetical protein